MFLPASDTVALIMALLFGVLAVSQPALSQDEEGHGYTRRDKRQCEIDRQESPAHEQFAADEAGDQADGRTTYHQRDALRSQSRAEVLRQERDRDARHEWYDLLHPGSSLCLHQQPDKSSGTVASL